MYLQSDRSQLHGDLQRPIVSPLSVRSGWSAARISRNAFLVRLRPYSGNRRFWQTGKRHSVSAVAFLVAEPDFKPPTFESDCTFPHQGCSPSRLYVSARSWAWFGIALSLADIDSTEFDRVILRCIVCMSGICRFRHKPGLEIERLEPTCFRPAGCGRNRGFWHARSDHGKGFSCSLRSHAGFEKFGPDLCRAGTDSKQFAELTSCRPGGSDSPKLRTASARSGGT
jgi:hypothetical protein